MANTKIPWELSSYEYISYGGLQEITDAKGEIVGDIECLEGDKSNANFIIKAVNNHDALVSALEKIVAREIVCHRTSGKPYHTYTIAKQALAKVKETL